MLASPGPWRLGVAVALQSRSPQTAAELAFYELKVSSAMQQLAALAWAVVTTEHTLHISMAVTHGYESLSMKVK